MKKIISSIMAWGGLVLTIGALIWSAFWIKQNVAYNIFYGDNVKEEVQKVMDDHIREYHSN